MKLKKKLKKTPSKHTFPIVFVCDRLVRSKFHFEKEIGSMHEEKRKKQAFWDQEDGLSFAFQLKLILFMLCQEDDCRVMNED